ncbi:hypothetical protein Hanom_Chr06g00556561 [Helianthus anomalus]
MHRHTPPHAQTHKIENTYTIHSFNDIVLPPRGETGLVNIIIPSLPSPPAQTNFVT